MPRPVARYALTRAVWHVRARVRSIQALSAKEVELKKGIQQERFFCLRKKFGGKPSVRKYDVWLVSR
jgi:hypothetical protein